MATYTNASEKLTMTSYNLWSNDGKTCLGEFFVVDDSDKQAEIVGSLLAAGFQVRWSHFTTLAQV